MVKLKFFLIKNTERIIPKMGKILSEALTEPAEILNPFSFRSFSFFNFTLLGSLNKISAELFNN
jgi:hypothetical protein